MSDSVMVSRLIVEGLANAAGPVLAYGARLMAGSVHGGGTPPEHAQGADFSRDLPGRRLHVSIE